MIACERAVLGYLLFAEGVVQSAAVLEILRSWEHAMCCYYLEKLGTVYSRSAYEIFNLKPQRVVYFKPLRTSSLTKQCYVFSVFRMHQDDLQSIWSTSWRPFGSKLTSTKYNQYWPEKPKLSLFGLDVQTNI